MSHETASPPGAEEGVRAELVALNDDWSAAIVSNDAARIAGFMADEWVIVSETGVSTRKAFLSVVESGDLSHSAMARISDAVIQVHGDGPSSRLAS